MTTDDEMQRLAEAQGVVAEWLCGLLNRVSAAEAEVERLRAQFPCDGGCNYDDGPNPECSLHGYDPRDLWEGLYSKSEQIETLHAENAELRATIARVRALAGRAVTHDHEGHSVVYADTIRAALDGDS